MHFVEIWFAGGEEGDGFDAANVFGIHGFGTPASLSLRRNCARLTLRQREARRLRLCFRRRIALNLKRSTKRNKACSLSCFNAVAKLPMAAAFRIWFPFDTRRRWLGGAIAGDVR